MHGIVSPICVFLHFRGFTASAGTVTLARKANVVSQIRILVMISRLLRGSMDTGVEIMYREPRRRDSRMCETGAGQLAYV